VSTKGGDLVDGAKTAEQDCMNIVRSWAGGARRVPNGSYCPRRWVHSFCMRHQVIWRASLAAIDDTDIYTTLWWRGVS
jgi:hypothetical protein